MTDTRRYINILIGLIFCGFMEYGFWIFPESLGGDISYKEMVAQDPSVATKTAVWRFISTVGVLLLFAWIVKKNRKTTV